MASENVDVAADSDQAFRNKDHHAVLQALLFQQWTSGTNCDLHIFCKGCVLPVHGCVLACFSPRVCSQLSETLGKDSVRSIKVRYDLDIVRDLVTFAYTGLLRITKSSAQQLLKCAQWFGIDCAVRFVQEFMKSQKSKSSLAKKGTGKEKMCSSLDPVNECAFTVLENAFDAKKNSKFDSVVPDPAIEMRTLVKQEIIEIDLANEELSSVEASKSREMYLPVAEVWSEFLKMEPDTEMTVPPEGLAGEEKMSDVKVHAQLMNRSNTTCSGATHSTDAEKSELSANVESSPCNGKRVGEHKCKWCANQFPSRKELFSHIELLHHPFACTECPDRFSRKENLTRHIQRYHQAPVVWSCPLCEENFSLKHLFQKHCKDVHNERKPFWCDLPSCRAKFTNSSSLRSHRDNVHGGLRVVCENCGKKCTKEVMYYHRKTCVETGQYLCPECGKVFNLNSSLKQHVKAVHRKEAKYVCSRCSKMFNHHRNLYRHMLIHDNICPYVCEQCGQRFRHSNSLKYHMEKKHPKQSDAAAEQDQDVE